MTCNCNVNEYAKIKRADDDYENLMVAYLTGEGDMRDLVREYMCAVEDDFDRIARMLTIVLLNTDEMMAKASAFDSIKALVKAA